MSSMPMKILVVDGPNLNLLGRREPEVYGTDSLADIHGILKEQFSDIEFAFVQSNSEGNLIDAIQKASSDYDGILINPGGFAHTSVALRDAIGAAEVPTVEVHLSNTFSRESFRHTHITAGAAQGLICGFGTHSYRLGVEALRSALKT